MTDCVKGNVLVSVIVPVYNVEKYLVRCIESILAQTYTNLEILLIDDGSTDSSGKMCDEYAEKDSRIRVIHQENQGLAEVRNVGIRKAKGEWIQFVNSDDWIDAETIETCYRLSQEYGADIVSFIIQSERAYGKSLSVDSFSPKLMSSTEALSLILWSKYITASSCNKFAKKDLFSGVEYPRGKLFEDIHTVYKYVSKAKNVLCTDHPFYHCLQRSGSITHSVFSGRTYDLAEAIDDFYDFAIVHCGDNEEFRNNVIVGLSLRKLVFVQHMIKAGSESYDMEYISQLRREVEPVRVLKYPHMNIKQKIKILLFKFSFRLYCKVYLKFRRDKA